MKPAIKKKLLKHNLVRVYWIDICGGVNENVADVNVVPAVTYGIVQSLDDVQLKVSSSLFHTPLSKDLCGDHTAIPGAITSVEVINKNETPWIT